MAVNVIWGELLENCSPGQEAKVRLDNGQCVTALNLVGEGLYGMRGNKCWVVNGADGAHRLIGVECNPISVVPALGIELKGG